MHTTTSKQGSPDPSSSGSWDSPAVARIIRNESADGESPAFLYLGRKEAGLLRCHLAEAFGEESVPDTDKSYYMGLKVVPVDSERYIATGGPGDQHPAP